MNRICATEMVLFRRTYMTRSEKGLHNATGHATGARETAFTSDDGPVDLRVSGPCTPAGGRTNQIFARRLGYLLSTPGLAAGYHDRVNAGWGCSGIGKPFYLVMLY